MHPISHLLLIGACGAAAIVGIAAVQERGPGPGRPGGGPVSRVAMALDTDHDTNISAAELRAAPAALATLDTNKDGRLTAEELRPAFNGAGRGDGPPEFEGRRGRGDQSGGAPASSPEDLADTLMAFDRNGDGRLDREEVPARFQGLFEPADTNKDGALTREELKQSASTSMDEAARGSRSGRGGEFGRGRGAREGGR
jgi:Ca2+-binding EF-hand superfamily protein